MKINRNIEVIIVTLLYLTTLYLWTLPMRESDMPYGEFDAISHWETGDYMAQTDLPITTLPPYIDRRYGGDNSFKPHTLWYHPPYHTNFAVMGVFGGQRIIPTYLLNAILSSFIVLILYFFMRKLFGFLPALLSSFLVMFSGRDIFIYLWGQWPERISYYMIPLILYVYYKYTNSYLNKEEKPIYLYLLGVLLGINMYLHPMGFFYSLVVLAVFSILLFIKEKKIFFNFKHLSFTIIILVLVLAIFPYQTGSVALKFFGEKSEQTQKANLDRLLYWFKTPDKNPGVPDFYFSFGQMHGLWTLPFLLLGIIFVLLKRKRKDLLLLSWLIGLYFMLHLDVIGKGPFVHRTLSTSTHIFIPFTVLGLLYLPSLIPIKKYRPYIKYALVLLFFLFAIFVNGKFAYSALNGAYGGVGRMNTEQYQAAEWMKENLPEGTNVTDVGVISLKRAYWIQGVSFRIQTPFAPKTENFPTRDEMEQYVLMDYSDLIRMGRKDIAEQILSWERLNLANDTLLYDRNNLRVYKIG